MPDARIWDISPTIQTGIPVWPGDTPYDARRTWQISDTCPVNVSMLTMSTHTGAHADAPLHYDANGSGASEMDLARYIGPCRVVDVSDGNISIEPGDVARHLPPNQVGSVERLLIRTYSQAPTDAWDSDFRAVASATIDLLADHGVVLIGVDTPSLDPEQSKTMDAHHAVRRHGLSILEGLVLDGVPEGDYELIALPLKLKGLDAAPVRAILRTRS